MSVGAVSSLAGRAHTSKCARSALSFSPLAIRPLDIRRSPGHVIPLSASPRPLSAGHRFSREEERRREEGGKRRSKSLRRSAITADSQNPSAFLPLSVASFRSSPPRLLSSFFHFLPMRGYRRDVPTCTSRTEGRKTWVLIRARRGCGSSRHYFTGNRLSLRMRSLFNAHPVCFY